MIAAGLIFLGCSFVVCAIFVIALAASLGVAHDNVLEEERRP